jgi:hypothetical protein
MCSQVFRTIDRAVLTSGASEADHQIGKATPAVGLHMGIDYAIYMFKKPEHFSVILKKLNHRLITSSQLLIWFVTTWIMDRTTIKNISTSISGQIHRQAPME